MALFASVINVDRCLAHSTWRVKREKKITADRMAAYSDAVFAVIVTIMVLELKAPNEAAFSSLWPLWPTAISYVVSYLLLRLSRLNDFVAGAHRPFRLLGFCIKVLKSLETLNSLQNDFESSKG